MGELRLTDRLDVPRVLRAGRIVNIAVKLLLVGMLVAAVVLEPHLQQLQGKGMVGRAAIFWIPVALLPAAWVATGRRVAYPHLPDALIVLPFVVDVAGNFLDLYDTTAHFDLVAHFANWVMLCTGFGALLLMLPLGRVNVAALIIGFGAFAKVVWEFGEYVALLMGVRQLGLDHADTMHDLAAGMVGAFIAAAIVAGPLAAAARR